MSTNEKTGSTSTELKKGFWKENLLVLVIIIPVVTILGLVLIPVLKDEDNSVMGTPLYPYEVQTVFGKFDAVGYTVEEGVLIIQPDWISGTPTSSDVILVNGDWVIIPRSLK